VAASKGNKAQEGEAFEHPNRVSEGTDLSAEKGLEGPRPIDTTGTKELETAPERRSRIDGVRKV
jgi:hypothetical protein